MTTTVRHATDEECRCCDAAREEIERLTRERDEAAAAHNRAEIASGEYFEEITHLRSSLEAARHLAREVAHTECPPDVAFEDCQEPRCDYARAMLAALRSAAHPEALAETGDGK